MNGDLIFENIDPVFHVRVSFRMLSILNKSFVRLSFWHKYHVGQMNVVSFLFSRMDT